MVPPALARYVVPAVVEVRRVSVPEGTGRTKVPLPAAAFARRTVVPELEPLKVTPAPPIVGVVNVADVMDGDVPNTSEPEPVSSEITVISSAEVVAAKALNLGVVQLGALPFEERTVPDAPIASLAVVSAALWYKTLPADPPLTLVARSDWITATFLADAHA